MNPSKIRSMSFILARSNPLKCVQNLQIRFARSHVGGFTRFLSNDGNNVFQLSTGVQKIKKRIDVEFFVNFVNFLKTNKE